MCPPADAENRPTEPAAGPPEPPPLPPGLLEPWRVIAAGAVAWVVVAVLSFTVPALQDWRPVSIAGLATGVLGTAIFLWQKSAVQRGVRGAQTGITIRRNRS
jgi:Protein of unknown function (DUF2530)